MICFAKATFVAAFAVAAPFVLAAAPAQADARSDIKALLGRYTNAVGAKDINAIMDLYVRDETLVVFDVFQPCQYVGAVAYRKDWQDFLSGFQLITVEVTDLQIGAERNLAYSHNAERWVGTDKEGKPVDITVRVSDVWKKIKGRWVIVHEHNSVPVEQDTGKADFSSKP